jgi:hypothetical protein
MAAIEEQESAQVIRPSQSLAWIAVLLVSAIALLGSIYVSIPWAGPAQGPVWIAFLGVILEVLWRLDLRPQLRWNSAGLLVVGSRRVRRLTWSQVTSVEVHANVIVIRASGEVLEAGFDRPYWLVPLSKRSRDLPINIERRLETARRQASEVAETDPPDMPQIRRPPLLFVAFAIGTLGILLQYL